MSIILRFVHCPGFLQNLILLDSNDRDTGDNEPGFSHIDAVTTDGKYLGAHVTGVESRPMDYDAGKFARQKFMLLRADDGMTAKWMHYLRAVENKHEGYDYLAIFGFITHLDLNQHHHTICSGFQALALRGCLYLPRVLTVRAHRISVRDLRFGLSMRDDVEEITQEDVRFHAHISAGT
jgi:hypothetical protein